MTGRCKQRKALQKQGAKLHRTVASNRNQAYKSLGKKYAKRHSVVSDRGKVRKAVVKGVPKRRHTVISDRIQSDKIIGKKDAKRPSVVTHRGKVRKAVKEDAQRLSGVECDRNNKDKGLGKEGAKRRRAVVSNHREVRKIIRKDNATSYRSSDSGKENKKPQRGNPSQRSRKHHSDIMQNITDAALRRIARRAGLKRVSVELLEDSRRVMKVFLKTVIQYAIVSAKLDKRNTVTGMDAVYALKMHQNVQLRSTI